MADSALATRKLQHREWVVRPPAPLSFTESVAPLPEAIATILYHRGVHERDAIDAFFAPSYDAHLHDPFLFCDMRRAVDRILAARERGERILVHGDYDADGVSGAAVLADTIAALGGAVDVFIPHRERDGYGFTTAGLVAATAAGARLIITCDCGIANAATITAAAAQGIDTIVTDHHLIPRDASGNPVPPPAYAILHPKVPGETYPFDGLTGGGVAFKLAAALVRDDRGSPAPRLAPGFEKWLLDCVAISTVADFGPLIGENRVLVKYGLTVLAKTRRVGLRALYERAGIRPERITTGTIGFQIAPRINAAGRIDHAHVALALLRTTDTEEAAALAEHIQATNGERRQLVDRAVAEAHAQVGELAGRVALVVTSDWWPVGIVGLVASAIKETYYRPAIALTSSGGVVAGSGRSIPGFHIVEALDAVRDTLQSYGGHPQACGLKLVSPDVIPAFTEALNAFARERCTLEMLTPRREIDVAFAPSAVTWDLVRTLERLQPFGVGNPTPQFLARTLTVVGVRIMGRDGRHCRIIARESDASRPSTFVCFRYETICPTIAIGDRIDIIYELGVNEWNGNREIQFLVVDVRLSSVSS